MTLSGLLDAVLPDPALAQAVASAGRRLARPDRAAGAAPVRRRRAGRRPAQRRRRPAGAGRHRHRPGRRGPGRRAALPAARRRGRRLPVLGDAAARAALARARTPSAGGWPCCAGSPTRAPTTRRPDRCGSWSRRSGRVLQPQVPGLGELEPVAARAGDDGRPGRPGRAAGRGRLRPGRAGREARRVRGPRRHPRRLPADRGAPGAGRVLGRRVEEVRYFTVADQRSLQARPSTGCGRRRAASCCSPRRAGAGEAARRRAPGAGRDAGPHRRRPRRGGHGGAGAGARRRPAAGAARAAGRQPRRWSATRSGCAPGRPSWCARPRSSWRRPGRRRPVAAPRRSTSAPPRCVRVEEARDDAAALGIPWWTLTPVRRRRTSTRLGRPARASMRAAEAYRGDTERALADVRRWTRDGWRVAMVFDGHGPAQRALEQLGAARCRSAACRRWRPCRSRASSRSPPAGSPAASSRPGCGSRCSTRPTSPASAASPPRTCSRMPSRRAQRGRPAGSCGAGDLRRARAARRRPLRRDGAADRQRRRARVPDPRVRPGPARPARRPAVRADRLARPAHPLRRRRGARRSTGSAARTGPRRRAARARRSRRSRRELIRLYSARMATRGHAFGLDTPWQRELEDAFPYIETPDQLAAINEVKHDMEQPVPMDRVICGDVGYGKTEIAVRAAFKAVQDGKQVAVLVPTTLLAQQHFATFSERMAQFPVTVRTLSRFDIRRRAETTLAGLRRRHGRHRHRHAPAAAAHHPVQGPGPGHRRRGAAVRRRAQGVPQARCAPRSTC